MNIPIHLLPSLDILVYVKEKKEGWRRNYKGCLFGG